MTSQTYQKVLDNKQLRQQSHQPKYSVDAISSKQQGLKSKFLLGEGLLQNLTYAQRNFAALCDSNMIHLSSYHKNQKFGRRALHIKLSPIKGVNQKLIINDNERNRRDKRVQSLNQPLTLNLEDNSAPYQALQQDMLERDSLRQITQERNKTVESQEYVRGLSSKMSKRTKTSEKRRQARVDDQRKFVKKIINHNDYNIGMIFMFTSFVIKEQESAKEDQENPKMGKLHLSFHEMEKLLSLDSIDKLQEFLYKNLEIIENHLIKIDQKDIEKIPLKQQFLDLPRRSLIENQNYNGFFLVEYPCIQFYVPDQTYTQTITLNSNQINQLLDEDFNNYTDFLILFDNNKFAEFIKKQRDSRQLNKHIELEDEPPIDIYPQRVGRVTEESQTPRSQKEIKYGLQKYENKSDSNMLNHLNVIVYQDPEQGDMDLDVENTWSHKTLKQVIFHEEYKFIVTFCPCRIQVKEKRTNKVLKSFFPNFAQFSALLKFSDQTNLEHFLQNNVTVKTVDLDEMELNVQEIKKHILIQVNWNDDKEPLFYEIGQNSLDNGLMIVHSKEITINNKKFIVELIPPTLNLYEQVRNIIVMKDVTTNLINDIHIRRFKCSFKIL